MQGKQEEEGLAMFARNKRRGAFTLVELLVVIVIIGMLMGLLIPAVNAARQSAKKTQCINHQGEIAKAILQYENAKQRYPGYVNNITGAAFSRPAQGAPFPGPSVDVSWVVMVLEYLGRNDLSEPWRKDEPTLAGKPPLPRATIAQLTCPSDSQIVLPFSGSDRGDALSYVVNPRIFRYLGRANQQLFNSLSADQRRAISPADLKSQQQTVLLSEKVYDETLFANSYGPGPWGNTDPPPANTPIKETAPVQSQLCFFWGTEKSGAPFNPPSWKDAPSDSDIDNTNTQISEPYRPLKMPLSDILGSTDLLRSLPVLKSNHAGGILVVTFCDGHTESILNTALCREYLWGPPVKSQ